jgi:hypothetical protein
VKTWLQDLLFKKFNLYRYTAAGTHLAAVLDAGLQVVCAAVRANTFIPVAVGDFQLSEGLEAFKPGAKCVVGLYKLNPVDDTYLESVWFQPLHL